MIETWPKRIAVTQPNYNVYSETFIRNHIRGLRQFVEVHDLAGGWIPSRANGKKLAPTVVIWLEKAISKFLGKAFVRLMLAQRVKSYLRLHQIEFVLCEYGPGGAAMAPICKKLGIPFGVHFFGLDLHGKKLIQEYGTDYKRMFLDADLIIAVSTLQKKKLEEMGCPPEKIQHIVCGADTLYEVKEIRANKPPLFIAVGRMVEKKAPLVTLQAFVEVCKTFPEARLCYIGEGPLTKACKAFVIANQLTARVEFLSAQKPEFISEVLKQALCFIQHSVTAVDGDSEGTPVAILEAGLAGVPVVSTRHAGIMDTVLEGETGFLVEEYDVKNMATAMLKLIADPELAHQMGRNAQRHIKNNYTIEITVRQLWEAIISVRTNDSPHALIPDR